MSITPALWPAVEKALSESEYFILMASPEAAASHWVRQEVDYWLNHAAADRILIVLTEGELVWDDAAGDFDWSQTTALPETLKQTFAQEPLYLDLRWAKQEEHLSLNYPKFRDAVAELAATLHGLPKDEITGEDVRQHRRTRRVLWSAVAALLTLTVVSVAAFFIALHHYRLAEERGAIALSRQLAAQAGNLSDAEIDLSLLLSVEAYRKKPTVQARGALLRALLKCPQLVRYIQANKGNVTTVAFSPGGTILASGGWEGSVRLWDMKTRQPLGAPLIGHKGGVWSVAFSPTGQTLASGSFDGTLRLWNPESGQPQGAPLTGHQDKVLSVSFSPEGQLLASGGEDSMVFLWDLGTQKITGSPLRGHKADVSSVTFSPDGKLLASASEDMSIILWDVKNRRSLGVPLTGHQGGMRSVAFSPDGSTLASGGADQSVHLWDLETQQPLGPPLPGHEGDIMSVAFSREGKLLASASTDGTVRLWDVDVQSWIARACYIANRNLTEEEWQRYMAASPYRKTIPDLQGPEQENPSRATSLK